MQVKGVLSFCDELIKLIAKSNEYLESPMETIAHL